MDASATTPAKASSLKSARVGLLLTLATLTSAVNILDRQVITILAEPVKRDLGLTDTQLGLLTGLAFALFYSTVGIPIARLVDRPTTDRPKVIAACIALWSATTALSGMVLNFWQLLVARILVGVGESGSGPAFFTLMTERVPAYLRARAFAIYGLGMHVGTLVGLVTGGLLAGAVGWRMTFVLVGAPGLILALVIRFCVGEPRRGSPAVKGSAPHSSIIHSVRQIFSSRAMRWLTVAEAASAVTWGLQVWTGVFLVRNLELSPGHAGLILGLSGGLAGAAGTFTGGVLADRLGARRPSGYLRAPIIGLTLMVPAAVGAYLTSDWRVFACLYWIPIFCSALSVAPSFALPQILAPERERATAAVLILLIKNIVGGGLAPLLIGIGSDLLSNNFGADSIRVMLAGVSCVFLVASGSYWLTGRELNREANAFE